MHSFIADASYASSSISCYKRLLRRPFLFSGIFYIFVLTKFLIMSYYGEGSKKDSRSSKVIARRKKKKYDKLVSKIGKSMKKGKAY